MLRLSLIAAFGFAATLGSAGVAAADDCMCALPDWSAGGATEGARAATAGPQSVELGPFFSSDGTTLSSRARREAASPDDAAPVEDVLWCSSPDDPRCAPADPGPEDGPHAGRATHSGAGPGARDHRIPPALARTHALAPRGGPRPGVRFRVERPPRR
jgi:hypothetical protein